MRSIDLKPRGRARPRIGPALALPALFALTLGLAACADEPTNPADRDGGGDGGLGSPRPTGPIGLVEITMSGLGTGEVTSSALSAPNVGELERLRAAGSFASQAFSLPGGDGTFQFDPVETGSFTVGERGNGGYRYFYATFRVRNARQDGTPYGTPRKNLTFYAVDTEGTLGETPVSDLRLSDDAPAEPALARAFVPTGAVVQVGDGAIASRFPDALQVLTEDEADDLLDLATGAGAAVTDVFPYGFVVRRIGHTATRELPENPAEDQFDGIVTFAYKVPLQSDPADDPATVSLLFLAVDDDEVKVTQSLEEQTPFGQAAFEARAAELGAERVTLLPGGHYDGAAPVLWACSPRTAGSAEAPAATLARPIRFLGLTANPGPAPRSYSFTATFDGEVSGFDSDRFVVRGMQSGVRFVGEPYSGEDTTAVTTPVATFHAGEIVEVVVKGGEACVEGLPYVARFRAATAPASGNFGNPYYFIAGEFPWSPIAADWNGDGRMDVGVVNQRSWDFTTWTLNFAAQKYSRYTTQLIPYRFDSGTPNAAAAAGDVNGDGKMDALVAHGMTNQVFVLLGKGDGSFTIAGKIAVPGNLNGTNALALGDLNGDGALDFVVNERWANAIFVALGIGDGTFRPLVRYDAGPFQTDVALADLDRDGRLDIVALNDHGIHIRLGNGDGTFGPGRNIGGLSYALAVDVADLNGDEIPDIAVADASASAIIVFLGTGDGTSFTRHATIGTDAGVDDLAVGDVDGDGDLDLVASARWAAAGGVFVLINDGNASFTKRRTDAPYANGVTLADLDGDGKLDVAYGEAYPLMTTNVVIGFGR